MNSFFLAALNLDDGGRMQETGVDPVRALLGAVASLLCRMPQWANTASRQADR